MLSVHQYVELSVSGRDTATAKAVPAEKQALVPPEESTMAEAMAFSTVESWKMDEPEVPGVGQVAGAPLPSSRVP